MGKIVWVPTASLNLNLLYRPHLMEHVRPGVCDVLAAGEAAPV